VRHWHVLSMLVHWKLPKLCNRYGLSGVVLDWLKSYLCYRPQRAVVDNVSSRPCFASCGVPQGSVLGPLLFSLYIAPLEDVIMSHGIDAMMYADDSQLYIFLNRNNRIIATEKLEACIDDVMNWITCNMLMGNPSKTEVIHFYSRYMKPDCPLCPIKVGGHDVQPKLQRLQNTAARLVVRERKSAHITPVLSNLNWLPVQQRVTFKLLLVTYKALNCIAPTYITDLLRRHVPARTLRSSSQNLLTVPRVRTETYGEKSFSCAAPRLWNNLPDSIKQSPTIDEFKAKLKTYLFRIAFSE
ncbi:Hypothetical predicted protein, partial [Paramuricea clavata]